MSICPKYNNKHQILKTSQKNVTQNNLRIYAKPNFSVCNRYRANMQQLTYSFMAPLQICSHLGEISCHAQHLAVACGGDERVAQYQRHQRQNKKQVFKDRHDSLTPTSLTETMFVCELMHTRSHVCMQTDFNTPSVCSKIIMQLQGIDRRQPIV